MRASSDDWEWMIKRQLEYNKRVAQHVIGDRTSLAALDLHRKIVAEVDALPVSLGGYYVDDRS